MASSRYTLSPDDAAEMLGVHRETVIRWADDKLIPCFRTPSGWRRFRPEDIEDFIAKSVGNGEPTAS